MYQTRDFEDIVLSAFDLMESRIYGDSVTERMAATKVLLSILREARVDKLHGELTQAVYAANEWHGNGLVREAADAIENIRRQSPEAAHAAVAKRPIA